MVIGLVFGSRHSALLSVMCGPLMDGSPSSSGGGRNPMNGHRAKIPEKNGKQTTPKDFLLAEDCIAEPITLKKGLVGAKPEKVCSWILDLLNFNHGEDTLHDLFPGSGSMGATVLKQCQSLHCSEDNCGGYVPHTERFEVIV